MEFIGVLCIILFTTTLASHFSKKIGLPSVIGQLLVGIVMGGGVLDIIHTDLLVTEFSEIGVILLMFLAGLESNLQVLKKYIKPAFFVALLGMILPIIFGIITGEIAGIPSEESIFLGIILTATSVSISVEVLKELNVLETTEGTIILGAAVIDDILSVLLVSLSITFLTGQETISSSNSIAVTIEQILYFILIYFLVKKIAPSLVTLSEKIYATSSLIIVSLIICLFMAYLADLVGLSPVIGAFFSGLAIGQTKVREKVNRNIEVLGYSIFIPVFFVSIGLNVSFEKFTSQFLFIFFLTFVAISTKLFGGFFGAKLGKFSNESSLMIGAGMVSRGEMALIILQLGSDSNLVSQNYYSSIVIVILITTLISPIILKYFSQRAYAQRDNDLI